MDKFGKYLLLLGLLLGPMMASSPMPAFAAQGGGETPVILDADEDNKVQEELVEMAVAIAEGEDEHIIIRTNRGAEFEFDLHPKNYKEYVTFEKLSEEQRHTFQERRMFFLTKVATLLDRAELTLGTGRLVKEKYNSFKAKLRSLCKKSSCEINPVQEIAKIEAGEEKENLREKGVLVIRSILEMVDRQLWSQSPVVVKQDQFFTSPILSVALAAGKGNKTFGGLLSFGFSFGYNFTRNTSVFEIIGVREKLISSKTPLTIVGFIPRLSFELNIENFENPMTTRKSITRFIPYSPTVVSYSAESAQFGLYTGAFSLPPIVDIIYDYKLESKVNSLFRITYSQTRGKRFHFKSVIPNAIQSACSRLFTLRK